MAANIQVVFNNLPQLRKALADFASMSITFGYQGDTGSETYENGFTVAANAAVQEFGTGNIPERSFLRRTFNERESDIRKVMIDAARKVANLEEDPVDAMTDVAIEIHAMFLRTLDTTSSWAAANAASTIEKKGHDVPLLGGESIHLLMDNLSWALRRKGKVIAEGR